MAYRVEIKRSAQKEIRALPTKNDRRRVLERIVALAENPRPPHCKKLTGQEAYRIRQGDDSIVYTMDRPSRANRTSGTCMTGAVNGLRGHVETIHTRCSPVHTALLR